MCTDSKAGDSTHSPGGSRCRGCAMAHPDPLSAAADEAADPPAQGQGTPQVLQLVCESGVKRGAVVHEEQPHIAPLPLQMGESGLVCCGHCVFCILIGSVGKLVGVKAMGQGRRDVTTDRLLKAFYHHWCKCEWPGDVRLLR